MDEQNVARQQQSHRILTVFEQCQQQLRQIIKQVAEESRSCRSDIEKLTKEMTAHQTTVAQQYRVQHHESESLAARIDNLQSQLDRTQSVALDLSNRQHAEESRCNARTRYNQKLYQVYPSQNATTQNKHLLKGFK